MNNKEFKVKRENKNDNKFIILYNNNKMYLYILFVIFLYFKIHTKQIFIILLNYILYYLYLLLKENNSFKLTLGISLLMFTLLHNVCK
jgi:hypothetical protein